MTIIRWLLLFVAFTLAHCSQVWYQAPAAGNAIKSQAWNAVVLSTSPNTKAVPYLITQDSAALNSSYGFQVGYDIYQSGSTLFVNLYINISGLTGTVLENPCNITTVTSGDLLHSDVCFKYVEYYDWKALEPFLVDDLLSALIKYEKRMVVLVISSSYAATQDYLEHLGYIALYSLKYRYDIKVITLLHVRSWYNHHTIINNQSSKLAKVLCRMYTSYDSGGSVNCLWYYSRESMFAALDGYKWYVD